MSNQYAYRDAADLDSAGGYYTRHVLALTREGLTSKADIAAELAHRDQVIDALKAKIARVASAYEGLRAACDETSKALDALADLEVSGHEEGMTYEA